MHNMAVTATTTKPKWKKILYAPQPYEDNYVADTFLEQMRTNANVQEHDYGGMVRSAAAITQQICAVLIFFSVFEFVRQDAISAALLGGIDVFLAVAGFAVLRIHLGLPLHTLDTLSSCLLFCATLSLLSPVLRTLTRSYADDTIWALATFLGLLHLITHDYNYVNSGIGRFSGTISLNAAIFTAVLLGSRLQSNEHVFAFVLLAIEIFAMFPIFQREVKRRSERLHLMTAAALFALSSALTWQLSALLSALAGAFVLFLALVCPLWFMHVQESKNEILGPWDIAHIQPEQ
ncbi:putative phosphatidylinositol N-acetylglucosaminyltransferase subunit C [Phytophthora cinnamomi]|uniref:putative phosphatidylinositol N-acetylglucosaminyltransferase subunit C n=1 Tax=Phytophthora cinnamomi TaxID=4785 RepID=UPI003559FB92|nr:putative phosphatidylinositol N-acetylglucosaminyltransferase subunit C [Phytophthora cinnamomi]